MSAVRIAKRYAKSLIDLSLEAGQLEKVYSEVISLVQIIESSNEFALMLKSPIIREEDKKSVTDKIFADSFSELIMAFIHLVIRKKREPYLINIAKSFIDQYNEIKQITPVKLTTAKAVNGTFRQEIIQLMQAKYGKVNIELTTETDEEILGGFILEFEDKKYDASILNQLDHLRKEIHSH